MRPLLLIEDPTSMPIYELEDATKKLRMDRIGKIYLLQDGS